MRVTFSALMLVAAGQAVSGSAGAGQPSDAGSDPAASPQGAPAASHSGWDDVWQAIHPSTTWFLHYQAGQQGGEPLQRVHVSRGYVTLKFEPVPWFQPRVTLDTHQDEAGDWGVRLKYLHAKLVAPWQSAWLSEPNVEVGIVHNPWFDYEEHINRYRAEGTMLIERNGVLNSADLGVTVGGLLGDKLPAEYCERVSSSYPGTWGSFAVGLYNGGGYHAVEQNTDKVFMGRLSLRPLGAIVPNLQLAHLFIYGKGNTAAEPSWRVHQFLASIESEYLVVAGQAGFGVGNQQGDELDDAGQALPWIGWSTFGEVKLPWIRSSLIARYDAFDWGTEHSFEPTGRFIAGHAFHFLPHNFLLASVDLVQHPQAGAPVDRQAKLTLQARYP